MYEWSDMSIRERCFTTPLVIEVHVPRQENEVVVMYLCVRGINLASFKDFLIGNKGNIKITELRTILQRESQNFISI